jgi:hypothetical protein
MRSCKQARLIVRASKHSILTHDAVLCWSAIHCPKRCKKTGILELNNAITSVAIESKSA